MERYKLKIISSNLFSALKLMICRDKSEAPNRFLFESARSSIFHVLEAIGVGFEDEVIVSAFTCSAVTYSILLTGAKVVYVDINNDLTMNREALLSAITPNTKVVIVQNTFGRIGADYSLFSQIRNHGIFIVEDSSLSIGSHTDLGAHGSFGDVSVWSLEASKSFTLGWGGVLSHNTNYLKLSEIITFL